MKATPSHVPKSQVIRTWMVYEDGKELLHRNAENEFSYCYFGNESGHSYEIYLSAYVKGQYVPISNIIKYTVK